MGLLKHFFLLFTSVIFSNDRFQRTHSTYVLCPAEKYELLERFFTTVLFTQRGPTSETKAKIKRLTATISTTYAHRKYSKTN